MLRKSTISEPQIFKNSTNFWCIENVVKTYSFDTVKIEDFHMLCIFSNFQICRQQKSLIFASFVFTVQEIQNEFLSTLKILLTKFGVRKILKDFPQPAKTVKIFNFDVEEISFEIF